MKKQGRGIASIMFGFGYGEGFPDHSIASVEIEEEGKILIRTAQKFYLPEIEHWINFSM